MIHEFKGRSRVLFFPKAWANSVVKWLMGVHSSDGSVEIKNTADPNEDGSIDLKVNEARLVQMVEAHVSNRPLTKSERIRVRDIVHGALDGLSLKWTGGSASVDVEWLLDVVKKNLENSIDEGVKQPVATDEMPSGFTGVGGAYTSKDSSTKTFGKPTDKGLSIMLCCRGADGGENGAIFFREFTWAGDGRLYMVDGEDDAMGMYTDQ